MLVVLSVLIVIRMIRRSSYCRLQDVFEMKFAKIPEDTGLAYSDAGSHTKDEMSSDEEPEDDSDGDDSEEEREKRLKELAEQVQAACGESGLLFWKANIYSPSCWFSWT